MGSPRSLQLPLVAGFILLVLSLYIRLSQRQKGRLPPGPKRLPIFGNIRDLAPPGVPEFIHWLKFKDKYGPISSLVVQGRVLIIVNDIKIADELLTQRSAIYSDRPDAFFATQLCGWGVWVTFQKNNTLMKSYRKDIHSVVGTKSSLARFEPLEETESHRFLTRCLNDPQDWRNHLSKASAGVLLQVAYGYKIGSDGEDPLVNLVNQAMAGFSDATVPGKWAVDFFPWLNCLPEWLPGTAFKRIARKYNKLTHDAADIPMQFAERRIAQGSSETCVVSDLLYLKQNLSSEDRERISHSAGAVYLGGSDTNDATLEWFFLAMLQNPDVQLKAREELDRVIEDQRLPTLADRSSLPYIDAIWKETLRWNPIAPLALPHVAQQDDDYAGYLIPKGAMILANVWWFLRDPTYYSKPSEFNPSRFMGANPEPDPEKLGCFGFGRRICPGRLLADQTGWLLIAQILKVFEILPVQKDPKEGASEDGNPGTILRPKPFDVDIRPRGINYVEMLKRYETELSWGNGDADELKGLR